MMFCLYLLLLIALNVLLNFLALKQCRRFAVVFLRQELIREAVSLGENWANKAFVNLFKNSDGAFNAAEAASAQGSNESNKSAVNADKGNHAAAESSLEFSHKLFWKIFAISILSAVGIYTLSVAVCGSLGLAFVLALILISLFYLINYLKFLILKEPLIWSDALLIKEIALCPRFYFSYVSLKVWSVVLLALTCLLLSWQVMPSMTMLDFNLRVSCALCFVLIVLVFSCLFRVRITHHATIDGAVFSPLWALIVQVRELVFLGRRRQRFLACRLSSKEALSENSRLSALRSARNIVLIQAESYCNLSRLSLRDSRLSFEKDDRFTSLGVLDIDYLGAYTMRSEFSVLTGLTRKDLGIYAYNPYILAYKQKIPSLASQLKMRGYTTICIHPNFKRFFSRDKVMQNLGFDHFVSITELEPLGLAKVGKVIGDESLLRYVASIVKHDQEKNQDPGSYHKTFNKLFIFVITIQAHGPWQSGFTVWRKDGAKELSLYAKHLEDLAQGVSALSDALSSQDCLILYGDHLPAISEIYTSRKALKPDVVTFNVELTDRFNRDGQRTANSIAGKDLSQRLIKASELNFLILSLGGVVNA